MCDKEVKRKWCLYCKKEIDTEKPFIQKEEDYYHINCYKQMNTFYDPFEDENT